MYLNATELANCVEGYWLGSPLADEQIITAVGTDTRNPPAALGDAPQNCLFVALKGQRFDAHAILDTGTYPNGYHALMVERPCQSDLPQLIVADTRLALGRLAQCWRKRLSVKLIALTGSNGKTTVKEMLASILRGCGNTLATQGNLNNDIGVPLTLLRLQPDHQFGVIEMGANHPGEIAYLTQLVDPDVALITNAGPAHLEGFGSIEGVAKAKGEIYEHLSADGTAVVALDDVYATTWLQRIGKRKSIGFSLNGLPKAQVKAKIMEGSRMQLLINDEPITINLPLPGLHNRKNALAAAAGAYALGIHGHEIAKGLETISGVPGRLQIHYLRLARPDKIQANALELELIDDSYNANPASAKAAIDLLNTRDAKRILVLGDMGELGSQGAELHQDVGMYARTSGIHHVFTIGVLAAHIAQGFGLGCHHFTDHPSLFEATKQTLDKFWQESPDVKRISLLVKGSRSQQMEQIVAALLVYYQKGA